MSDLIRNIINDNLDKIIDVIKDELGQENQEPDHIIMKNLRAYFSIRNQVKRLIQTNTDVKQTNFTTDWEKMRDFFDITKKDFLASYSYITEEEYNNTAEIVKQADN